MRVKLSILAAAACALGLAMPMAASNIPAVKTNRNMPAKKPAATAVRRDWAPENLAGRITIVDSQRKLVVVQAADGVPFDMVVTPKTRIDVGDRAVNFNALAADTNKAVSVEFTPERRGDVARSIRISG